MVNFTHQKGFYVRCRVHRQSRLCISVYLLQQVMKIPRFVILEFSKLNAIPLNLCVFNDIRKGQWIYHDMTLYKSTPTSKKKSGNKDHKAKIYPVEAGTRLLIELCNNWQKFRSLSYSAIERIKDSPTMLCLNQGTQISPSSKNHGAELKHNGSVSQLQCIILIYLVLRQGLTVYPRLVWSSLSSPCCPWNLQL